VGYKLDDNGKETVQICKVKTRNKIIICARQKFSTIDRIWTCQ